MQWGCWAQYQSELMGEFTAHRWSIQTAVLGRASFCDAPRLGVAGVWRAAASASRPRRATGRVPQSKKPVTVQQELETMQLKGERVVAESDAAMRRMLAASEPDGVGGMRRLSSRSSSEAEWRSGR
jgi:hypothetical protein